ncbi:MAG: ATP-binding protein [Bacteroidetes bacterium]|nr:ATP-binding protein [Bacteroidota bacterium]MCW5896712.1 ATP-binding protein [Bacteroidota bacterium]
MQIDPTYLGTVINVSSNAVEVEISTEIPSTAPIISGRVHRIGQLGTLVKLPIGHLTLYGIVSSVSNSPVSAGPVIVGPDTGRRFIQVQLLGEQLGGEKFIKGVGTYPTINDEVHLVTENDLKLVYGGWEDGYVEIGKHSSSSHLPVFVDLKNLVLRHTAVLGSTGSGKSNATAGLVKSILRDYRGSRIILVDPHGEYATAFSDSANVFRIDDEENPLYIPFWAMTFDELAFFLVGRKPGEEKPEDKRLREQILDLKKANASKLTAGVVDQNLITSDSPVPFDIRQMWYTFDREVNATYNNASQQDQTTEALREEGNALELKRATFEPYSIGAAAPFKSKNQTMYPYIGKIYSRLRDSRFDFMFHPGDYYDGTKQDIDSLLKGWIDSERRLTILDLSGVPFELIDISVGLITRMVFDSMYWGRYEAYTGKGRPLLMVFEEAHSYLPKTESASHVSGFARKAVEKVFKEGRKFGVGAMIVSQRPSEVSDTILSQVGTFVALRLTNSTDKAQVQAASPNNLTSLMELLPSLRIGEAIVVGEGIQIPTRVRIALVTPRPDSNDPDVVGSWKKNFEQKEDHYKRIVTDWREQKKPTRNK